MDYDPKNFLEKFLAIKDKNLKYFLSPILVKHNFKHGFFSKKSSEINLSLLSKHLNEKNTLFLGAGSVVYVNPICIGLKQYIKKTDKQSSYSFFSIQYTISRKNHIVPTFGLISERTLRNNSNNIKFGVMTFLAPNGVAAAPILRYQRNF